MIADTIILTRQKVCPRTSYASGGSAASVLCCLQGSATSRLQESWLKVQEEIVSKREFDEVQMFSDIDGMVQSLAGHVICVIGDLAESQLQSCTSLITASKSNLIIQVTEISTTSTADDDDDDEDDDHNRQKNRKRRFALIPTEHVFSGLNIKLNIWQHATGKSLRSAADAKFSGVVNGFNGQPATSSRRQFKFLWGMLENTDATSEELEDGKLRVLCRLESKASLLDKRNVKQADWDRVITEALRENKTDAGIYSLIRERILGKTLASSLRNDVHAAPTEADASSSSMAGVSTDGDDDDRSEHLVTATLECLGEQLLKAPKQHIKKLLDYGCAEGGITSILSRRLQMEPQNVYGADVRSITSKDFTFLQLPAEDPETPPAPGTILPSIADNSISLINCAMVFHHVIHVEAVLRELRRVVSPSGVLILREHDCHHKGTAAFLDILHGLYSLAWKDPIEWPAFIDEYKAYYRTREQWTELMQKAGFALRTRLPRAYTAAENSIYRNGRFPNVTRAYYAVYVPNWDNRVPPSLSAEAMRASLNAPAGLKTETAVAWTSPPTNDVEEPAKKRARGNASAAGKVHSVATVKIVPTHRQLIERAALAAHKDYEILESTQHPGRFFKHYPASGKTEWIHF